VRPELLVKILLGSPTISAIQVNYHQDFVASTTATSYKDVWIAYSIGLTIPGKLGCLDNINNNKKLKGLHVKCTLTLKIIQNPEAVFLVVCDPSMN
jgi:hypothetical protein